LKGNRDVYREHTEFASIHDAAGINLLRPATDKVNSEPWVEPDEHEFTDA
jgi:hypothetical protein